MISKRKIIIFNKYLILLVLVTLLIGVGSTYAYYAFQKEEDSVIVGNVVSINVELEVDLVVGSNSKMVPLKNNALSNALKGVGSSNGACVDSLGNLSCQVYRIKLINKGSKIKDVNGTIELYAKDGEENTYKNLKWRELSNVNTMKDDSVVNGMEESFLVKGLTIASRETLIWYIAVWIRDADLDQSEIDKGAFGGTVKFEAGLAGSSGGNTEEDTGDNDDNNDTTEPDNSSEIFTTDFVRDVMAVNATSDKTIDFSTISNTSGIFYIENTKGDTNPIYYYRGEVNNDLIFADFCWKIVRTTDIGGLKLLYNGVANGGTCNNRGSSTTISSKEINANANSLAYSGYMYGAVYETSIKNMVSDVTTKYYYSGSYTYSSSKYRLEGKTKYSNWNDIYDNTLDKLSYTCFSSNNKCGDRIYYLHHTDATNVYYITLYDGETYDSAINLMLKTNTTSGALKGGSSTVGSSISF